MESQTGLGESILHLEGKRLRDKENFNTQNRANKRQTRQENVPLSSTRKKQIADDNRQAKLTTFTSTMKVAELCSGQEKCCNGRCLEASTLT